MDGNHSGLSRLGDAMTALNVRYVTFQMTLKNMRGLCVPPIDAASGSPARPRARGAWQVREDGRFSNVLPAQELKVLLRLN
jgi:hypothetical protein